ERELLPRAALGKLERVLQHAVDAGARVDRLLRSDLAAGPPSLDAAGAGVQALGVLAHDDQVDVFRSFAGERRGDTLWKLHRAEVDVEIQLEPQPQQQVALEDPRRHA